VIALDTNILIYLLVSSQPEHLRAKQWLEQNTASLATTHTNIGETLRLLTHPRVFSRPLDLERAVMLLDGFLTEFDVATLTDSERWWTELVPQSEGARYLRGNEVFDARIALCLRHHGISKICTLDSDFEKYPFLKIIRI